MEFNLRTLKTSDVFPMFQIMNKIGFKDLKNKMTPDTVQGLMTAFNAQGGEESQMTAYVGFNLVMEVAGIIMENLPSCENDLYTFLSNISGMKKQEIADLAPADFMEMIIAVIQKDEFKDFFKVVSKLFNQGN